MHSVPARPALRYHGGKFRLGAWIAAHFPPHRVYVEPYGGAAGVLLRKPRSYAEVYNDLDGDVVTLYRVLRDPERRAQLADAVRFTPFSRAEFVRAYEPAACDIERSRRLLVRSHMGFGSAGATRAYRTGFRSNVVRSRTTPAHDWQGLPEALAAVGERLAGVTIECDDALAVLARYDTAETLHYVDPPYTTGERATESACYAVEMDDAAHETLAAVLHGLRGAVVLSGYDSPLYASLYGGWHRVERETHASGQNGAVARTETLWLNPAAASRPLFAPLP